MARARTITDWRGATLAFEKPPSRVVSLVPSLTETLFALGVGNRVVGVSRYCIHPAQEVAARRDVGGTKNPDLDAIVSLRPDLVMMNAEENHKIDVERLEQRGLRVHVSFPKSVDDVVASLRDLGAIFEACEPAESMISQIETARRAAARHRPDPPPCALYLVWWKPIITIGPGTYIADLLGAAGARVPLRDREDRYPRITLAEMAAASPDLVLLSSEPYPFSEAERREIQGANLWPDSAAARVRFVDGELASWHGARTARGIAYLSRVLGGADPPAEAVPGSADDVPSPCIGVCELDERTRVCRGCARTIEEIAGWSRFSAKEKRAVLRRLATKGD
ncbi:MAG: helical backbone metal receptor, partial [Steroidobacteraceae bacterium]